MSILKNIRTRSLTDHLAKFDKLAESLLTNTGSKFSTLDFGSHFELRLPLPGYAREDINIDYDKDVLTVVAKNTQFGTQEHSILLGSEFDITEITAKMTNGLLIISIAKNIEVKKRNIPVQ